MTKNRLKSSLNAAIGDLSTREPGSSDAYPRRISNGKQTKISCNSSAKSGPDTTTNIVDSIARQAAIDRIEEDGFSPATFKSDADSARAVRIYLFFQLYLIQNIHSFSEETTRRIWQSKNRRK
jgi:hypothetical protein